MDKDKIRAALEAMDDANAAINEPSTTDDHILQICDVYYAHYAETIRAVLQQALEEAE